MGNFMHQLAELKALLLPCPNINLKSGKSSVYSTLLQLQEHSATDPSLLQSLADSSHILLSSMAIDISDEDEEIAAQALKCLGFMVYHPSIVTDISGDDANMVLSSLQKVILATRIKSVRNLGVWCISVQQFNASFLNAHIDSLVRAIIHALDNPTGSLSTTFEAIQAVMKLATQLNEKMRETSNLWAPPIYRRLVSADKREKDMAERCLLKIRSTIFPPPIALYKAVVEDVQRKLLPAMEGLLKQGMKIQVMQAWGWFTRMMGPYAMKNRHLINKLLKIPEQTFPDSDPQVQIASQIAWEALIDALVVLPTQETMTKVATEHSIKQGQMSEDSNGVFKASGLTKRAKLIMTPLIGIMSSKCQLSVHLSCLNTWNYLLHKLDTCVNCPSVINIVLEPMLKVVFQVGPDGRNIWSWNFCLELLDNCALARGIDVNRESDDAPGDCSWKHYPIKWSPWNLGQFDFFVKMIHILITHGAVAYEAALRIFRSALKGLQRNLTSSNVPFSEVISCINTIIMCLKKISKGGIDRTFLQFIEIATEELQPLTLGSPLYKLVLDSKYSENSNQVNELRHTKMMVICSKDDKNMVSSVVYLIILYYNSTSDAPEEESVLQLSSIVSLLLTLYDPYDILHIMTFSLYKYSVPNCLNFWIVIANCLKDHIDGNKDPVSCKSEPDDTWYLVVSNFLAYPFAVFFSTSQKELDVEQVVEPWKSFYVFANQGYAALSSQSFCETLLSVFNWFLEDYSKVDPREKTQGAEFLSFCGNAMTCVLEHILKSLDPARRNKDVGDHKGFSFIKNSLQLAARFLSISYAEAKANPQVLDTTSRVFFTLVCFVESFHFHEDVILFVEIMQIPLLQWLSDAELQHKNTICKLHQLWIATLKCLRISWPPINFDSTFLKLQATLLETTLDHPNCSLSDPTIAFWNSTYGDQIQLDYPQNLLPVLDKLARNGKINLCKRRYFRVDGIAPHKHKVTTTLNRCVKRVELMDDKASGSKRRKLELTEHQKEVRHAQQGRSRDSEGHGPGVRTYTSVDFSQGNEDDGHVENEELRNA